MSQVDSEDRYEVRLRSSWQEKALTSWSAADDAVGDAVKRYKSTGHTIWVWDVADDKVVAVICSN